MIDRYEEEKNCYDETLLEQISKSIANVYDNDKMRTKIRGQLVKFENDRKQQLLEHFKMKRKLTDQTVDLSFYKKFYEEEIT